MTVTFQVHYVGKCAFFADMRLNRFGAVYSSLSVGRHCPGGRARLRRAAIALRIRAYAPHRQRLGSAATCSSLGFGLASSSAAMAMMKPGSQ